ncbi:MAG: hypothetical protein U1E65_08785 [Myxococcota bacterium]
MDREELKRVVREVLEDEGGFGTAPIAERWNGGKLVIKPRDESLQSKEIPLDTFFHKIVMVRDKLRVLEQKINASSSLSEAEKVDLEQYITKIYGSLTTFNALFRFKEDNFVGAKGDEA